jgi:tetratricopeptide (TPR) repeat protein
LGAAGAVVFALWSTAEPRTCEGVELSDVWNVAQRHRIESAVRASGASYGPDLIRRIGPRLDAHARAWMAMTRDACEANRMRHTQSDDVFGLRMACLEDRRRELVAVVEVLGELSPSTVEHALDTIGGLGSIEACADVPMLVRRDRDEHRQPMPDDLAQALARVETLVDAGDFDRAFAQVEPLLATAHGSFEHEGEILLAQAWVQVHTEPAQAQQVLHEALLAAEVSGADDLRLRAMILMVFVVGYAQGHHTDGLRWGELADALAQKLQASPLLTARLARYRGRIQQEQGNYDGALMSYEGARTVLENAGLSDHLEAVKATAALADVLRARQRYGEGEAYLREAVQQYREMAGPEHPRVANALHALGDVVAAQDRPDEATQLYRETLRMLQDSSGREHVDVGGVRLALGRVALGRGDLAGARAELETAHTIFERNLPPEHPRQAQVLASLAELRVHEHRDHDALPLLLQAVDVRRRATPRHPDFAVVLLNLGTLHLRMGDPVAATVALREAVAVAEAALGAEHAFVTEIRAKLSEATGER